MNITVRENKHELRYIEVNISDTDWKRMIVGDYPYRSVIINGQSYLLSIGRT